MEHVRGQRGPGGAELVKQASSVVQHRQQRLIIGQRPGHSDGNRGCVFQAELLGCHSEQPAQQLAVAGADTFHPAFPLRHHVRVDRGVLTVLHPRQVRDPVGHLLLRPAEFGAQLAQPGALGVGGHD
jgi:hypothetical protein